MDELIVVSVDSHATMPVDLWPVYLEREYHTYIPELREDDQLWTRVTGRFAEQMFAIPEVAAVVDEEGVYERGVNGLWDADVRVAQMDREGTAAEFVYYGDHRASIPFMDIGARRRPAELWLPGMRAYHRWAVDTFGRHPDRLFLVGSPGVGPDMEAMLRELEWIADHGFAGTYAPRFVPDPAIPPLYDAAWEPFWSRCVERNLPIFVHAGHGVENGPLYAAAKRIDAEMAATDRTDIDWSQRFLDMISEEGDFFADLGSRRPLWQLMLGGVFDRHPGLKLVVTEERGDWLPATLRHLDEVAERQRDELRMERRPSEYWQTNCLVSLSFIHKAEVAMRDEIGLDTITFGRDYPHEESTWPNTRAWLRDAFSGVPEVELRKMLGDNAIGFFGLDRAKLSEIARRIGPSVHDFEGPAPELHPIVLAHMDGRGGYLKPAEGDQRMAGMDQLMKEDLAGVGATV
jgi:predicted TIM-barrel fold metal-dependent hydrolase